ncbi:MAG TPA: serine/threonine-protein kinase [Kofleriaceae bacterium]|nr:serine/threonine-protein kinase [Kofleriaceae bacterium]
MEPALRCGAVLLGKYRIDRVLGQGGMAVVLKVTHLQLGEELAIKILLPDATSADSHARFVQEAQSVARLRGEHIARIADVGVLPGGAPYMLMEYLRGVDLADELQRRGHMRPGEAVDYALQTCAALAEAHAHGIVHRDIKPGNLFLTARPDGTPLIKVLDFGISKDPVRAAKALTQTQTVMGTPGYMSPEQMKAAREVDARTDLWSLGVVLYECLTGHAPFEAESFAGVVFKIATEPPAPIDPRVPRALQAVVLRCLEKDRAARWPSVAALAAALAPFARDPLGAALAVERTQLLAHGPIAHGPVTHGSVAHGSVAHGSVAIDAPRYRAEPRIATTISGSAGASHQMPRPGYARIGKIGRIGRIGMVAGVLSIAGMAVVGLARSDRSTSGENASATASAELAASSVPSPPPAAATALAGAAQPARPTDREPPVAPPPAAGSLATTESPAAAPAPDPAPEPATDRLAAADAAAAAADPPAAGGSGAKAPHAGAGHTGPCDTLDLGDAMTQAATQYSHGAARTALALVTKALACRHSPNMYRLAGLYACAAFDPASARLYYAKTSPELQPAIAQKCQQIGIRLDGSAEPAPPQPQPPCNTIHVDDLMARAANQYTANNPRSALALADVALACQRSGRLYWLATTYACAAHDAQRAMRYFRSVPAALQAATEQRCQQDHIAVRP